MSGMFEDCTHLTSLDVSSFRTENVIDLSKMFSNCELVKELDVKYF